MTATFPTGGFGGNNLRITGAGFLDGASVTLDGVAAPIISFTSTAILVVTPAHAAGKVDVVVTNPDGRIATLTGGYIYDSVTLTFSPNRVASGSQLSVSWIGPNGRAALDWIGLFKLGASNTSYENGWWEYTNGAASGTLTLSAPTEPGAYEFRFLLNDGYGDVARSTLVTVSAATSPSLHLTTFDNCSEGKARCDGRPVRLSRQP